MCFMTPVLPPVLPKWWLSRCRTSRGGLGNVLRIFSECDLNVEYLYAFVEKRGEGAVVIVRVEEIDRAVGILQQKGIKLLTGEEVYKL